MRILSALMIPTLIGCLFSASHAADAGRVVCSASAGYAEKLAAREIRRYVYLRTDEMLDLVATDQKLTGTIPAIVVGRKDQPLIVETAKWSGYGDRIQRIEPQSYFLRTIQMGELPLVLIVGGDDAGVLYGAYRFAEHLGVRFYLHGDLIPDERIEFALPNLDEAESPLFETRGILPFHDFPEGPDWWNLDGYKAVLSQLPKLRMNFIGFHTYPHGGVGPEPMTWIGRKENVNPDGTVQKSYPSRHFTTHNGTWGYQKKDTSAYSFGGAQLYEHDAYGADYMIGRTPVPECPDECNALFNEFGALLNSALTYAGSLGIKTCLGTETPITIPYMVSERNELDSITPTDPEVVQRFYEGIFTRIKKAHPLDYYWFWTSEHWTWHGVSQEVVDTTIQDMQSAIAAAEAVDAPFTLATCGWVLGPQQDRSLFDEVLPKSMPMSCINRAVGKDPVEPGFADIEGRPKWAIPWLEDDPAMTAPQLWAGRMRRDAFDALRYGCTGLMGIHWRTRILGPTVSALALAAWDQTGWSEGAINLVTPRCDEGILGHDNTSTYPPAVEGTMKDPLYRHVRYNMTGYRLVMPSGTYNVTLRFVEPHYEEAGKRVFGVKIQGETVIERLDVFTEVGKNEALDRTFEGIKVGPDGRLEITFDYITEFPCIAAIDVTGPRATRKINCGGEAHKSYEADLEVCPKAPRDLDSQDFYTDWVTHMFGESGARRIAAVYDEIDGELPQPIVWVDGPGGILPDPTPWEQVAEQYEFVDELIELRDRVEGVGNLDRYDYWLDHWKYLRAVGELRCIWGRFNAAMDRVDQEEDADKKSSLAEDNALPIRIEMIDKLEEVYGYLLNWVSNTGEMGVITNWEQHIWPKLVDETGKRLSDALGKPLPKKAMPRKEYAGPTRVFVPVARTAIDAGESLEMEVTILAESSVGQAALYWRSLGEGRFSRVPLEHKDRGVYTVELTTEQIGGEDFEYYVEATDSKQEVVRWPVTSPEINQTVVVVPTETGTQ